MIGQQAESRPGNVIVQTTNHQGRSLDDIADSTVARLISIAESADPVIRQQAEAYRDNMRILIRNALDQAVQSDRTTLNAHLRKAGLDEIANSIRRF